MNNDGWVEESDRITWKVRRGEDLTEGEQRWLIALVDRMRQVIEKYSDEKNWRWDVAGAKAAWEGEGYGPDIAQGALNPKSGAE